MEWQLFEGVPPEELRQLLSVARRRTFSKGEVVFHQHDPGDSMHLVVKGRFAIRVANERGESLTVAVRGPGDNFGEMALVEEGARRAATVAALEPAESFAVYVDDFQRMRRGHPQVSDVLIAFLAREVRRHNQLLLEALYLPAEKRVLRRLVELSDSYAVRNGTIPLTQEELAELAGTSRATVNRVLREEQERGAVELQRGRTTVLDPDALARRGR